MIEKYINDIFQNRVPDNKGYIYVTTETIQIPIYKVTLSISKRHITNLELVEEMILRLSSVGITNLDTIAGVLGLPRDIVDITVGDLHLKNLAFHSSGNCILMAKGRESIKNLSVINREKDILNNVFVDAITGEISGEKNDYFRESFVYNDTKMKHIYDANTIEHYRRNMDSIRLIFDLSAKTYLDDNMKVQDELVSIDAVEDVVTGFIDTPIHIYASESGYEIDIVAQRRSQRKFLEAHKESIIEQLRDRKLLPNLTSYSSSGHANLSKGEYLSTQDVYDQLKEMSGNTLTTDLETQAHTILFSPRILFDNELIDFCRIAFSKANKVEIMIDNLNYWSKNYKFLTICSLLKPNTECFIYYCNSGQNISSQIRRIKKSGPNINEKRILKAVHNNWFQILVDSKFTISTFAESVKVFGDNRYILRSVSTLSLISNQN
ncbi:hypothetical protein [Caproicibacterium amylolyticum]|uniref:Uncharacterized protein n=1 Tax=Caproicibacterium amylolyticum TaxID=2766537 RepID=A0A7G9WGM9_9FIRM|nr:hypothetical protein [Caproicibacterium amylolyticum]QNO17841.1 hypothetical protein H6X83_13115 [Caproicibacterium amylolyticum]